MRWLITKLVLKYGKYEKIMQLEHCTYYDVFWGPFYRLHVEYHHD